MSTKRYFLDNGNVCVYPLDKGYYMLEDILFQSKVKFCQGDLPHIFDYYGEFPYEVVAFDNNGLIQIEDRDKNYVLLNVPEYEDLRFYFT